jgi:hypothetical protein
MAIHVEDRRFAGEAEPVGVLTEGAAGIAVIALAIIGLAGISTGALVAIATIVIGVGLIIQAFNSAAENSKLTTANEATNLTGTELAGEVLVDCLCGLTGIVLGVLALVGIAAAYLVPSALIVFGGALALSGASSALPRLVAVTSPGTGQPRIVSRPGSVAAGGMEVLIGLAAIILGILAVIFMSSWVLVLVGYLAVGAALLLVSASFSGAVLRLFATD